MKYSITDSEEDDEVISSISLSPSAPPAPSAPSASECTSSERNPLYHFRWHRDCSSRERQ